MLQSPPKLSKTLVESLRQTKNLLAFSAGSDSSALFFILLEYQIPFDIALVNYQTRPQCTHEEEYAKHLAKKFNKKVYIHHCSLANANFEHEARKERYHFFEKIIIDKKYDNLLMAHHLGDQLEWFFMQLSKGAGLVELLGMQESIQQNSYKLIRPLLHVSKNEINTFLNTNQIKHFIDASNQEEDHKRNRIRKEFAKDFLDQFEGGIKKSFEYLHKDAQALKPKAAQNIKELFFLKSQGDASLDIRAVDKIFKNLGYLLSASQRKEILRTKSCVIAQKFAVEFSNGSIFVAPLCKQTLPKPFKEACRVAKIPSKIRPYMYKESIEVDYLLALMS